MMLAMLAQAAADPSAAGNEAFFLWGCILFAAALVLLVIELFIPSGGLLGLLCGVAAIGSVVAFFRYDNAWGVGVTLGYVILGPIAGIFVFKLWINSPVANKMILGDVSQSSESSTMASEQSRRSRLEELRALIGVEGVTETALRPVGTVLIDGRRVDGLAETGVIEARTPVIVTDVYDNQIKVRPK